MKLLQNIQNVFSRGRLRNMVYHSGFITLLHIFIRMKSAISHNRRQSRYLIILIHLLNFLSRSPPVHHRHINIHKYKLNRLLFLIQNFNSFNSFSSIRSLNTPNTIPLQNRRQSNPIKSIIIHNQ